VISLGTSALLLDRPERLILAFNDFRHEFQEFLGMSQLWGLDA